MAENKEQGQIETLELPSPSKPETSVGPPADSSAASPAPSSPPGLCRRILAMAEHVGYLNFLLLAIPIAIGLWAADVSEAAQFIFSAIGIIPVAGLMGDATEVIADHLGPGIGGLMNATFGNAAELILGLFGIFRNLDTLVKASLTGSIIGNILLVLGASVFAGGIKFNKQVFNRAAAGSSSTMAVLTALGLLVPAIFHNIISDDKSSTKDTQHRLSIAVSIIMFVTYILTLFFQLVTHKHLFDDIDPEVEKAKKAEEERAAKVRAEKAAKQQKPIPVVKHTTEEEEGPEWSVKKSMIILVLATGLVAWLSEILTGAVEKAGEALGLGEVFMGVVVVAIVGNAAEHSTAVLMARKNKMDIAVSISFGSALQISLFVVPLLVFFSYARVEPMDLLFTRFETFSVASSVVLAWMIVADGEAHWLEGIMLLMYYVILALGFFYLPEELE